MYNIDIRMAYNQLNGYIPSEIGNLNNLNVIYLNNNCLYANEAINDAIAFIINGREGKCTIIISIIV